MASVVADNPFDTQPKASAGIIQQASSSQGQDASIPSGVGASTMNPYTTQVDRSTQTTAGQIDSLLSGDSPLIQRARTLATQQMAQRGLINSSMNSEAGVAAVLDRVTPIAQTDAQIYDQRARDNAGIINQAGMFNAGELNRFALQRNDQGFTAGENAKQREFVTTERLGAQQFQTSERMGAQSFQMSMQEAQQNFTAAQNNLDRAHQLVMQDKSIQAQINLQQAQQAFQAAQADLDRAQQREMQAAQLSWQSSENSLQRQTQTYLAQLEQSGMDRRQAQQLAQQWSITQLEQAGISNRFDQELALRSSQFNAEQLNADRRALQQQQFSLEQMGYQARLQRETLPTQYAATVSSNLQGTINNILSDPNLDANARRGAIDNAVNAANANLDWAESFYNTSIPNIGAPLTSTAPASAAPQTIGQAPPPPAAPEPSFNYGTPSWFQQDAAGGAG